VVAQALDDALAAILGAPQAEDPADLEQAAVVLDGEALILRSRAGRLRLRAAALEQHAAALDAVADADSAAAAACLGLEAALAWALQCNVYARRARRVLLRTMPRGAAPRDESIVYRAARSDALWWERLGAACEQAGEAARKARRRGTSSAAWGDLRWALKLMAEPSASAEWPGAGDGETGARARW
jgi:hypothetical protein